MAANDSKIPRRYLNNIVTGFQRVGTAPLRPLPLTSLFDIPFMREYSDRLDKVIFSVIYQYFPIQDNYADARDEVDPSKARWGIYSRGAGRGEVSYITVLVVAPWDPTCARIWKEPCAMLKYRIDEVVKTTNVLVEMVSPLVLGPAYFAPVLDREDLDRDWNRIKAAVRRMLERHASTRLWSCIALFRFGLDRVADRNPPTVYVSMGRESPEHTWQPAVNEIEKYLECTGHGLQLHVEHSRFQGLSRFERSERYESDQVSPIDSLMSRVPYEEKASMGNDLSASAYVAVEPKTASGGDATGRYGMMRGAMVGTLGCYIEVADQGRWRPFALTNYHVIRPVIPGYKAENAPPAKGSPLRDADLHGFKPGHNFTTSIESPSRNSHNRTVGYLSWSPKYTDQIRDHLAFFSAGKHVLGHLYAGSGLAHRTPDNGMLDWALIEVRPSRLGNNNLPRRELWPCGLERYCPSEAISGKPLGDPTPAREVRQPKTLFKCSTMTRATSGVFCKHYADMQVMESSHLFKEGRIRRTTTEAVFVDLWARNRDQSATHGDSGAVVYDEGGRSVGLQVRGWPDGGGFESFAVVTPMEHVLAHIAEFLGLRRSDVRIARFDEQLP